jgi:antitoxin Phd
MRELRDTKAKLFAVIDDAAQGEPSIITRHGKPEAVVIGFREWQRLSSVPSFGRLLVGADRAGRSAGARPHPVARARALLLTAASRYSTSRSTVSSRSASAAGLSQRMRCTRGKRIATPDLWRVDRCTESKAISSTRLAATSRTGP